MTQCASTRQFRSSTRQLRPTSYFAEKEKATRSRSLSSDGGSGSRGNNGSRKFPKIEKKEQIKSEIKNTPKNTIIIDLCSDDESPVTATTVAAASPTSSDNPSSANTTTNTKAIIGTRTNHENEKRTVSPENGTKDNDIIELVPPGNISWLQQHQPKNPLENAKFVPASYATGSTIDEEVAIIGSIGPNPLADFPHSRENCVVFPINNPSVMSYQHCPNCYCYVCDEPASKCQNFKAAHCLARHNVRKWQLERQLEKRRRIEQKKKTLQQTSENNITTTASRTMMTAATATRLSAWQYRQAATAYPVSQIGRHVTERSDLLYQNRLGQEEALQVSEENNPLTVKESSVGFLLDQVTRVYPSEKSPPLHIFPTILRHYQRQSLAFMLDVESSTDPSTCGRDCKGNETRGGWLASEVGMGKSAIVIALAAAAKHQNMHPGTLKTTVVLTSVSLMGQWEDECRLHCPSLVVRRFHPASRSREPIDLRQSHNWSKLADVDIIISTATFRWPETFTKLYNFQRVVMDESHLFSSPSTANVQFANQISAKNRWCVTATPCTSSVGDLQLQMKFLGMYSTDSCGLYKAYKQFMNKNRNVAPRCNEGDYMNLGEALSNFMIRHVKSQCIGGADALKLPTSTTEIISVTMSTEESGTFNRNLRYASSHIQKYRLEGVAIFPLENNVIYPLSSDSLLETWRKSSKIMTLLEDIKNLKVHDEFCKVVVFTQYKKTHSEVCSALKTIFHNAVYKITGSTTATDRDFAIRVFQNSPRTFGTAIVITMKAGSVGMTLTNATHLYLMEPSLDPSTETQALGRLHRLGQKREVVVKKFIHQDTLESNVHELHEQMKIGAISVTKSRLPASGVQILTRNLSL